MAQYFPMDSMHLNIARGLVKGASVVFLSGKNEDVATNSNESVWMGGGLYPWSTWDAGAATLYVKSSNAADTNKLILIDGLDSNFNMQSEVVALNGTTAVATTKSYIRLNNVVNVGSSTFAGDVSVHYGTGVGTVVGYADSMSQMSRAAIYTVPNGYTAYTVYGDFAVSASDYAQLDAHWRFYGGVFLQIYSTETTGAFKADPIVPGAIPAKTDIDNRVSHGTNNLRCMSNQQLILIKTGLA